MVDIKTAVRHATEFAEQELGPERTMHIRLEEVDSSNVDGRAVWLITLSNSLSDSLKDSPSLSGRLEAYLAAGDAPRQYKVFAVAKDNGEVLSMKIRLFDAPMMK